MKCDKYCHPKLGNVLQSQLKTMMHSQWVALQDKYTLCMNNSRTAACHTMSKNEFRAAAPFSPPFFCTSAQEQYYYYFFFTTIEHV